MKNIFLVLSLISSIAMGASKSHSKFNNYEKRKPAAQESIEVSGKDAQFLYELADAIYGVDDERPGPNKVDFDGGCIYKINAKARSLQLEFCESYNGQLTDAKIKNRLSEILLTYLPLDLHDLGRVAGKAYHCERSNQHFKCEFIVK